MKGWVPIKGFSKYEINPEGIVRNVKTKKVIAQHFFSKDTKACMLYDDYGRIRDVKVTELLESTFPQIEDQFNEWTPIKDFEKYLISRSGKVKNTETNRIFNPQKTNKGYFSVTLKGKDNKYHAFLIHRLVAEAYIPNPDNLPYVNHIDENRRNNNVTNLEWVSPVENSRHASLPQRIGTRNSIPVNEYDENGKYLRTWKSYKQIELIYETKLGSNKKDGYCCGHIFRPYSNSINDLKAEEMPKYKPKKAFNKEDIIIPRDCLYTSMKIEGVPDIFKKYRTIGVISSSDRKKDFETVFKRIEELENELSKQK